MSFSNYNQNKELTCKALLPIFTAAKEKGIDLYKLIDGTSYKLSYLLNKHERIEWDCFCKIVSNSRSYFTQSEYEKMGRDFVKNGYFIEGVMAAFLQLSSNKFSRIFARQFYRIAENDFKCLKYNMTFPENNRVIVTI